MIPEEDTVVPDISIEEWYDMLDDIEREEWDRMDEETVGEGDDDDDG